MHDSVSHSQQEVGLATMHTSTVYEGLHPLGYLAEIHCITIHGYYHPYMKIIVTVAIGCVYKLSHNSHHSPTPIM